MLARAHITSVQRLQLHIPDFLRGQVWASSPWAPRVRSDLQCNVSVRQSTRSVRPPNFSASVDRHSLVVDGRGGAIALDSRRSLRSVIVSASVLADSPALRSPPNERGVGLTFFAAAAIGGKRVAFGARRDVHSRTARARRNAAAARRLAVGAASQGAGRILSEG